MKPVTRYAPSPTGKPHIGHLRTAAYSYALAKKQNGEFILRIEDTDQKRYKSDSLQKIKAFLEEYKISWDSYYVQSQRASEGIYKKRALKLVEAGHAFYCNCKPKNAKEGFSSVLRDPCRNKNLKRGAVKLKVPDNQSVDFKDLVIGKKISWDTNQVPDTTLLKSKKNKELPTYHLAATVDDHLMGVTHVLRGYDWLPSTPIHLLVYKFLGYQPPIIGHLTDIQSPEGGKLSKRKGSTSLEEFESEGFLKEAVFNFTILMGWAPKDNREFFTLSEFVDAFDINGFQKANPRFNFDKLLWFNSEYIKKMSNKKLAEKVATFYEGKYEMKFIEKLIPLVKERMRTLKDFENLAGFFKRFKKADSSLFDQDWRTHLKSAFLALERISPWNLKNINESLMEIIEERNFHTGKFFMNLRVAITGSKVTPPINESIEILGKKEVLKRIEKVLAG